MGHQQCLPNEPHSCNLLQVLTLAGELLDKAQGLLKEGLTTTEIADGYMKAAVKVWHANLFSTLASQVGICLLHMVIHNCDPDTFMSFDPWGM